MILIADYGLGNLRSIASKLARAGVSATVSDQPNDVMKATRIILPGVGHFATGMRNLLDSGLAAALHERVINDHVPILGICLGMQLFARSSEEGNAPGFGWILADVVRLRSEANPRLRIPHVGWNTAHFHRSSTNIGSIPNARFYFTHSYHVQCDNPVNILASTSYGIKFASAIELDNIVGVQFHPEKSHHYGMDIILAFCKKDCRSHA